MDGEAIAVLVEQDLRAAANRKAIGWVLRDTARQRPGLVFSWLEARAQRAAGVTVREAVKYFSSEQRRSIEAARRRR